MSYYKRKKLSKTFTKTLSGKLVPDSFVFAKNKVQTLLENEICEATTYVRYV